MNKFRLNIRDLYSYPQIVLGFFLIASGKVFMLKANLGMSPWGVFEVGVTHYLPITLGRVNQIVSLCLIIFSLFLHIYPWIGTLLCMFFVGFFIDIANLFVPTTNFFVYQIIMVACGVLLVGMGIGMYVNANLGAGPRDGLMLGLSKKTGKSIRMIRAMIEITVLVTGFLLGGPVGIGTVAFALAIGPTVQFFLNFFPKRN